LHLAPDSRVARKETFQTGREVVLPPQRGAIYDSRGRVLAMSLRVPSVFADPSEISDRRKFVQLVSSLLALPPREVAGKISDRSRRFVWIKRRVDPLIEKRIGGLSVKGLHVTSESARLYPERELAAQVIGVVGDDGVGLEGLERSYDHLLRSDVLVVH